MAFSNIGFTATFILGATHTLEPGHGKSLLTTYLMTNKVDWKKLFSIIGTIFITHFTLLIIIAFLLKQYHFENIEMVKNIAPLFIILFGVYLLVKNIIGMRKYKDHEHTCSCDGFHSQKSIKGLSVLMGLIPCPTVLTPIFITFQNGQFDHIYSYLLLYVLGMITSMSLLLIFIVNTKKYTETFLNRIQSKVNIHLFSAILIITVGVVYSIINWMH